MRVRRLGLLIGITTLLIACSGDDDRTSVVPGTSPSTALTTSTTGSGTITSTTTRGSETAGSGSDGETGESDVLPVDEAFSVLDTIRTNAFDAGLGGTDQAGEGPCPLDRSLDVSTADPADEGTFEETWWFEQGSVTCWLGPLPEESSEATGDPDTIGVVHVDEAGGDVIPVFFGDDDVPVRSAAAPLLDGSIQSACNADGRCVAVWSSGGLAVVHLSRSGASGDEVAAALEGRLEAVLAGLAALDPTALDYSADGTA